MGFPTEDFTVSGDPGAIRDAARKYSGFGGTLGTAASTLRGLDTGEWTGSEADTFREHVNKLPDPLQTASDAFADVTTALNDFANQLEHHQRDMDALRPGAEAAYNAMVSAGEAANSHKVSGINLLFNGGITDAQKRDQWNNDQSRLDQAADAAGAEYDSYVGKAAAIKDAVHQDALSAASRINAAAAKSPTADQNWFLQQGEQAWNDAKGAFNSVMGTLDSWAGAAGAYIDKNAKDLRDLIGRHADIIRKSGKVIEIIGDIGVGVAVVVAAGSVILAVPTGGASLAGLPVAEGILDLSLGAQVVGSSAQTVADWGDHTIDGKDLVKGLTITVASMAIGGAVGKTALKLAGKYGPVLLTTIPGVASAVREISPAAARELERLAGKEESKAAAKELSPKAAPSQPEASRAPGETAAPKAESPKAGSSAAGRTGTQGTAEDAGKASSRGSSSKTTRAARKAAAVAKGTETASRDEAAARKQRDQQAKEEARAVKEAEKAALEERTLSPATPGRTRVNMDPATGQKTKITIAEPTSNSALDTEIADRLADKVAEAKRMFDRGEFTASPREEQILNVKKGENKPSNYYAIQGTVIDRLTKVLVRRDPFLKAHVTITDQGKFGPDFIAKHVETSDGVERKPWFDITTQKQWDAATHRTKYQRISKGGTDYGNGTGILYR